FMTITILGKKKKSTSALFHTKPPLGLNRVECVFVRLGKLLFNHAFIVTSFSENISPERVFETYKKRGTMENYIKEAKKSFFFDKTDSPEFTENHARMMVSVLAYNLFNFLKTCC